MSRTLTKMSKLMHGYKQSEFSEEAQYFLIALKQRRCCSSLWQQHMELRASADEAVWSGSPYWLRCLGIGDRAQTSLVLPFTKCHEHNEHSNKHHIKVRDFGGNEDVK